MPTIPACIWKTGRLQNVNTGDQACPVKPLFMTDADLGYFGAVDLISIPGISTTSLARLPLSNPMGQKSGPNQTIRLGASIAGRPRRPVMPCSPMAIWASPGLSGLNLHAYGQPEAP